MKISLITACYNSAKTIKTAMDSVLAQKDVDVEYIVVDGGSTDGTVDIIKEFGVKSGGVEELSRVERVERVDFNAEAQRRRVRRGFWGCLRQESAVESWSLELELESGIVDFLSEFLTQRRRDAEYAEVFGAACGRSQELGVRGQYAGVSS